MVLLSLATRIDSACRVRPSSAMGSKVTARDAFDQFQFEADPAILNDVAHELVPHIPDGIEVLAGLQLGGVPIATALSLATGLPLAIVRKVPNWRGPRRLVEGAAVAHRRVLIVEDVVRSGSQVLSSTLSLRLLGAIVEHSLCVVDMEEGGTEKTADARIELHALFTRSELDGE